MWSVWNFRVIWFFWVVVLFFLVLLFLGFKFLWIFLNDLLGIKIISSLDFGKGIKEFGMKGFKGFVSKKNKDEGNGRYKLGIERIISLLCVIM